MKEMLAAWMMPEYFPGQRPAQSVIRSKSMFSAFRVRCVAAAFAFRACALLAQTSAPPLAFEVASIKPSAPLDRLAMSKGLTRIGMKIDAARVDIGFLSLTDLIRTAYKVKPYQVQGPDWMSGQRFDITAKLPAGATKEQVPEMLQALLVERFKLTVHRQTKEQPVYDLVQAKGGSKLLPAVPDSATPPADPSAPPEKGAMVIGQGENQVSIKQSSDGKSTTVATAQNAAMKMTMTPEGVMQMQASKMDIAALIGLLSRMVDRPIMDRTELKGNYQVALDLSMDDMRNMAKLAGVAIPGASAGDSAAKGPADAASDPAGNSVFTAVQKMGLKLVSRKEAVEFVVVDHLERVPTEN